MKRPLLSVIVPAYNVPLELFSACVNSVLRQTYDFLELIVVDDGSGRFYADAMDDMAKNDARMHVYHQANGGVSKARNTGLAKATGEFLIFIDADDVLADGWAELGIKVAVERDIDVVAGHVVHAFEAPSVQHSYQNPHIDVFGESEFWRLQLGFLYAESGLTEHIDGLDVGCCSKIIRARCVEGVKFPDGVKLSEDQVFNQAVLRRAKTYALVDMPSYYYIENCESASHSYHADALSTMMRSMTLVKKYIYDRCENWQAFYFKVVMEACTALQFMAFSSDHPLNFCEKIACLKTSSEEPLLKEAFHNLELSRVDSPVWRLKAVLLRYRLFAAYILLKEITDVLADIRNKRII